MRGKRRIKLHISRKLIRYFSISIVFIICIMTICLIYSLVAYYVIGGSFINPLQSFLYIIGYGEQSQMNLAFQNILALVGIIAVSLLTSYFTTIFFFRVDNVKTSSNMIVWHKMISDERHHYVSVLVGNKGRSISRLQAHFVAYDEHGKIVYNDDNAFTFPLLIKNSVWEITTSIELVDGNFFYELLKSIKVYNRNYRVYLYLEFVDNSTGQETFLTREYIDNTIVFVPDEGVCDILDKSVKEQWALLNHVANVNDGILIDWLKQNIIPFNIHKATPINAEAISLSTENQESLEISGRKRLTAFIDFEAAKRMGTDPPFAMALLSFNYPYMNWTTAYQQRARFQFEVSGTSSIKMVKLEIKDHQQHTIIGKEFPITREITQYTLSLSDFGEEKAFEKIREICFTVFPQYIPEMKPAALYIDSCELYVPHAIDKSDQNADDRVNESLFI